MYITQEEKIAEIKIYQGIMNDLVDSSYQIQDTELIDTCYRDTLLFNHYRYQFYRNKEIPAS